MTALFRCGIQIHPENSCLRKHGFRQLLNFLGSCSKACQIRGTAGRTLFRQRNRISAVMTDKTGFVVQSQGYVTVKTFDSLPAGTAGNKGGISSSVHKQHHLFFLFQAISYQLLKAAAENGFVPCLHFFSQIHYLCSCQHTSLSCPVL